MPKLKRSLSSLLHPQAVAVVGASENPDKVGGRPLRHLLAHGYAGRLYPVTQRGNSVLGLPAYASLDLLPEVPDVAILSVPAVNARTEIENCARLGIPNVLLFSSGFAEVGETGRAAQETLSAICRNAGIRLLGPNTIGVANFANGAVLSFASIYLDCPHQDGPVSIVSQSGAFGVSAYAMLRANGVGVRHVCATGNQADVDVTDFVAELSRDASRRVILLYLEEVREIAALRAALDQARRSGIVVLAMLAGGSQAGARSAGLHTGSIGFNSQDGNEVATVFLEYGCRLARSLPELCESVPLYLASYSAAAANGGLLLVSNSGACCVIGADIAAALGLPLAELSPATRTALDAALPEFSLNRNPLDLTAMLLADPSLLGRVMNIALADAAVSASALGLLAIGGPSYDLPRFVADCGDAVRRHGKPCAVHSPDPRVRDAFARAGLPVFDSERAALEALYNWRSHISVLDPLTPALESPHA